MNTSTVIQLTEGQVTRHVAVALALLDEAIISAITAAKDAGIPQGLVVALMHAHAHSQTADMLEG